MGGINAEYMGNIIFEYIKLLNHDGRRAGDSWQKVQDHKEVR